jgi:hypothetical protein
MTEQARADRGSAVGGIHFQISKLLVVCVIAATAATGALVISVLVGMPGPVPAPGPNGLPPPPPDLRPLAVIPVITGLFVLAWLAVLVVFSRDQILLRVRELRTDAAPDPAVSRRQVDDLLAGLRAELAADRERELQQLSERIAELTTEYGERRETDGYLNGMRMATADPAEPKVRSIRRTPPQR